jgi:excisionase family DNA binding protein
MSTSPLIGITADELEARIERAVERVFTRARPVTKPDRRTAEDRGERPGKDWLTNKEAMAYLGLSRPTLQRYRAEGRLPFSKVGGNVYYRRADLDALLESGSSTPDTIL